MKVSRTLSVGTFSAVACTMFGLLSASSLLMAGTDTGQAVQVTGQATSVMPKSNATPEMLKAASAAAPASQGDPTFGNGPAPGPLGPGQGCNLSRPTTARCGMASSMNGLLTPSARAIGNSFARSFKS
jgi:hypothetical protein